MLITLTCDNKKGRAIGEREKALEIAQALIEQKMPLEKVVQITGLTETQIRDIKDAD